MKILLLILILALPNVLKADPPKDNLNGNTLHQLCQTADDAHYYSCTYFIIGAADMHVRSMIFLDHELSFCVPAGVTKEQVRDVVIRYLEDNPSLRHNAASLIVLHALKETYPCL